MLDVIHGTTDSDQLEALARAVQLLGPTPEQTQIALGPILNAIRQATSPWQLPILAQAVQLLGSTPEQTQIALGPIFDAIHKITDSDQLEALARAVQLLGSTPEQTQVALGPILDVIVIVRCKGVADVIDGVRFAREHGLAVAIRGGGHNVAGHAVCDGGLMLDLSGMRAVRVDPERRRAWVEGGATWRDVDRNTQAFGLATPGGLISDTGVAGLTLAGGIGWLRARHGLCIDNLLGADVVTADGRLIHASATENEDLFWALRGGGGNFGVVTGFEFALHPVGPEVMFCAPIYPIEAGAAPIRFWRDFLADKNDRVGSLVEFSTVPEDPAYPEAAWGRRVYTIAAVYNGEAAEGEALLQPLRELDDLVTDLSGRMAYGEVQKLFDAIIPFGQHRCYWKCHYLAGLEDALIDAILAGNAAPPSPSTLSSIWNFGGATAAVRADATAFGDRSMPYMFSIDAIWSPPDEDAANIAWARAFWDRLRPYSQDGRMYLNFPGLGEDGDKSLRATYGANYDRLRSIKRKYDPANLFRFNQNITPS